MPYPFVILIIHHRIRIQECLILLAVYARQINNYLQICKGMGIVKK
jgi:hypothetical protein